MGDKYSRRRFRTLSTLQCALLVGLGLTVSTLVACISALIYPRSFGLLERIHPSGVLEPRLRGDYGATFAEQRAKAAVDGGVDSHAPGVASVLHSVMGRRVVVLDDFVRERERKRIADRYIKLTGADSQQDWHREKASDLSVEHNAMAKDMAYGECHGEILRQIRLMVPHFYEECSAERPIWVTRCTIYAQTFIDVDEAHQDHSHDGGAFSVTAIWYPHERWHASWGGETTFLSTEDAATADLLLPVLPKPRRLLLFDSQITHMARPASVIAEPFAPRKPYIMSASSPLASTRTSGNRFSFVSRILCGLKTPEELVSDHDGDGDGVISRPEFMKLLASMEIAEVGAAIRQAHIDLGKHPPYNADDLRKIFDLPSSSRSADPPPPKTDHDTFKEPPLIS